MIYLLMIVLALLGDISDALRCWRRYKNVPRINAQPDIVVPYPCRDCGEWPHINFGKTIDEISIFSCECGGREILDKAKNGEVKIWNKEYGTLDETDLKLARAGIRE